MFHFLTPPPPSLPRPTQGLQVFEKGNWICLDLCSTKIGPFRHFLFFFLGGGGWGGIKNGTSLVVQGMLPWASRLFLMTSMEGKMQLLIFGFFIDLYNTTGLFCFILFCCCSCLFAFWGEVRLKVVDIKIITIKH